MTNPPAKRLDLGAWLADLRRLGGQARTLAERHDTLEDFMSLTDLQMLEEATKRIIVSLNKSLLYGVPSPMEPVRADWSFDAGRTANS